MIDLLLPLRCLGCGGSAGRGREGAPICPRCATRLTPLPSPTCARCGAPGATPGAEHCELCTSWPPGVTARSATAWAAPASRLVEALKYDGWREIAPLLGRRLARAAGPRPDGTVLTAVPSPPDRLRRRGFNPAEEIAKGVAEGLEIPLVDALERPVAGARQVGLLPDARAANVGGAFRPRAGRTTRIRGRHVILVDDVLTTGATAVEASRVLLDSGASSVRILTFARAVPRRPGAPARAS